MRAVLQRVGHAAVVVDGVQVGAIERGLLILLGVGHGDTEREGAWLANKVAGLRIFPDDAGRMNRSMLDDGLSALVVSQFTLYGDCRKGRRPSFIGAAPPERAVALYERFCEQLHEVGVLRVERGVFQADMAVTLLNDGPVTLVLDSADVGRPVDDRAS